MATPIEAVYTAFYDKIERDAAFFDMGATLEESEKLAEMRSHTYLKEAISYWKRKQSMSISLKFNDTSFEEELTDNEIDLIAMIMVLMYYQKVAVALKSKMHIFSSADIKALYNFSPAQERSTFLKQVESYKDEVDDAIDGYGARDRITNGRIPAGFGGL